MTTATQEEQLRPRSLVRNRWDHRGGSWYGSSWEEHCEWASYTDPGWYDAYRG